MAVEGLVEAHGREYRRRRPEGAVLYAAVRDNLATLLAEASEVERGLPRYVERDFARYLECGVLAHDFARVRCESCKDELLVAFSYKGRGVCPSCNAKRACNGRALDGACAAARAQTHCVDCSGVPAQNASRVPGSSRAPCARRSGQAFFGEREATAELRALAMAGGERLVQLVTQPLATTRGSYRHPTCPCTRPQVPIRPPKRRGPASRGRS
ncbi:MAG: transposase zinc-binding domain-containing protein [Cystobacter sp.]